MSATTTTKVTKATDTTKVNVDAETYAIALEAVIADNLQSDVNTFRLCVATAAALANGNSLRKLAARRAMVGHSVGASTLGQWSAAVTKVKAAGINPASETKANIAVVAAMRTAVGGGSTAIRAAILTDMLESAKARGIGAAKLAAELHAESIGHALTKAAAKAADADSDSDSDAATKADSDALADALAALVTIKSATYTREQAATLADALTKAAAIVKASAGKAIAAALAA